MPVMRKTMISGILVSLVSLTFMLVGLILPAEALADTVPGVTSQKASGIGAEDAILNGELDDDGGDAITEYGFYYGESRDPVDDGTKRRVGTTGLTEGEDFDYILSNLEPDTRYYFVAYARNSEGYAYGDTLSFRTEEGEAPEVTTRNATEVEDESAVLNGELESTGGSEIEEYGFYWGESSDPVDDGTKRRVGYTGLEEGEDFDYELTGLEEGEKYYFAAYAKNSEGTAYGSVLSFTAESNSEGEPEVSTRSASSIDENKATLNAELDSIGDSEIEEYGFYYGTSSSPSTKRKVGSSGLDEGDDFVYRLTGLNPDTRYYFKAYATNDEGTSYGSVLSFTTEKNTEPAELKTRVSEVSITGATLTGTITSAGGGTVSEYGFVWGKTDGSEKEFKLGTSITIDTDYMYILGGLETQEEYYAKAYAVTSAGTAYGNRVEFTTGKSSNVITPPVPVAGAPVVVISSPTPNSAVEKGTTLSIYASASDNTGVQAMGLYINGVQKIRPSGGALAYSLDTSSLPLGTNTIRVTAWDGKYVGEQAIIINIQAGTVGTAPAVTISSPTPGYQVSVGSPVEIAASSSSSKGVQAMGLYINGVKKMRCGGAFFSYYLDTKGMSTGIYTIRVTAWDGAVAGEKSATLIVK